MKKRIITAAAAILVWGGLMAGSAMALMIDHGTKILLDDGWDWNSNIRLSSTETFSDEYNLEYSLDGSLLWEDVSSVRSFSDGSVLDFRLVNTDDDIRYILSGDMGDDRFSVNMEFDPTWYNSWSASSSYQSVSMVWTIGINNVVTNSVGIEGGWARLLGDNLSPVSTPVPEPGTMVILGTCLLCLGGAASRKKKKK